MVSRDYILQAARKSNTVVARAFLKALGYTPSTVNSKRAKQRARYVNKQRYRGMDECRKQKHGVVWHDD